MPSPTHQAGEPNIPALYSELNKFLIMGDHEKTLKASNKILHVAPNEIKAFQCRIISYIHLSKFQDAVNAILHNKKIEEFRFELAYCYYRLYKPEEAFKTLENVTEDVHPGVSELKAQILYRLEKFDECKRIYISIMKNSNDEYQDERETNFGAVIAGIVGDDNAGKSDLPELRDDTYELCYNKACKLVAEKQFTEAEKLLRRCEKLCMEQLLDEEGTEEEIEDELAIARVQLAYCMQKLGRELEAQTLYQKVLKNKPDDITLQAVAANNCVVINSTHNVFDSKKKMKIAISEAADQKLNTQQRKTIAVNNCLFNIINSIGNYKQHCDSLLKKYPEMKYEAALGNIMGLLKDGNDDEAITYMLNYSKTDPKHALYLRLLAAQICLGKGDKPRAIRILLDLGDDKFLPGIVSALVILYLSSDETQSKASEFLDEAVEWFRKNKRGKAGLEKIYREAADFHMRNDKPEAAAKCLEEILLIHPDSRQIIAQLVMAYAEIKSPKAKILSDRLPPISTGGLDVDELESANWMMGIKSNRSTRPQGGTMDTPPTTPGDQYIKKTKKKRRSKLPKNYILGETPDPERWLPKYERTGFRKKRDRRNKDIIKGSQGSAGSNSTTEIYDYSGHSGADSSKNEGPSMSSGSSERRGGSHHHKRKNKRR